MKSELCLSGFSLVDENELMKINGGFVPEIVLTCIASATALYGLGVTLGQGLSWLFHKK